MTEEQFLQAGTSTQLPAGMTCRWTYCDFEDDKFFCDWVAPSKQALIELFQAAEMPFDAIYPVRIADWALGGIEPARQPAAV